MNLFITRCLRGLLHHGHVVYTHSRMRHLTELLSAIDFDQLRLSNFLLAEENQVDLFNPIGTWLLLSHDEFYNYNSLYF